MLYQDFKTERDLIDLLKTNRLIRGKFLCSYNSQAFYEVSCTEKTFRDCVIVKGDFVGTNFTKCSFENTIFRESGFATVFEDCDFIDCIFSNTDPSFSLENCRISSLHHFSEEEPLMEYRIQEMERKAAERHSRSKTPS